MRTMLTANHPSVRPQATFSFGGFAIYLREPVGDGSNLCFNAFVKDTHRFTESVCTIVLCRCFARNTNVIQMRFTYPYANGFLCARKLAQQLSLYKG